MGHAWGLGWRGRASEFDIEVCSGSRSHFSRRNLTFVGGGGFGIEKLELCLAEGVSFSQTTGGEVLVKQLHEAAGAEIVHIPE